MESNLGIKVIFGCSNTDRKINGVGPFLFKINNKDDLPLDFWSYTVNRIYQTDGDKTDKYIQIENYSHLDIDKFSQLEDCYDEEYKKLGYSRDIMTAEWLYKNITKIESIELLFDDISDDNLELIEFSFIDICNGDIYKLSNTIINDFNYQKNK